MKFQIVGCMHGEISLREKVSFTNVKKLSFFQKLQKHNINQAIILSTCNRSQVILFSPYELSYICKLYQQFFQIEASTITAYEEKDAYQLLLEIIAGINSAVFGEDEIYHQVKQAYAFSQSAQMLDKQMHFIMQSTFRFAKKIRREYKMNEYPRTTTYIAYQMLKQNQALYNRNILLCGSGALIQSFLPYLYANDCKICIMLRNAVVKKELMKKYPLLTFTNFEERWEAWQWANTILSATSSPHIIFPFQTFQENPKFILDLALPRDVDEKWKNYHIVYDIDYIQKQLQIHDEKRNQIKNEIQKEIDKEVIRLQNEMQKKQKNNSDKHVTMLSSNIIEDTFQLIDSKISLTNHERVVLKKTLEYSLSNFIDQKDEERE